MNSQRLFDKYLNLPDGGTVLYDDSLPDVRMDRAGIAGRYEYSRAMKRMLRHRNLGIGGRGVMVC